MTATGTKSKFAGAYRLDLLIFLAYQLCHALSTQQLFPVFLNYTPQVGCFGTRCTEIIGKCYEECDTCEDLCTNTTSYSACEREYRPDFLSAAMEYRIYCKDFYKTVSATSLQYAGVVIGNSFVGYLADNYGRRFVLLISLAVGIPELFLSGFIISLPAFYSLRFVLGISVAGVMSIGWTYCSEMISAQHRFKLRTFASYSMGRLVMIGLSHLAGEWRLATFLHGALCCCTLLLILFLPESVIWLRRINDKKRIKKAERKIAWINGFDYSREDSNKDSSNITSSNRQMSVLDVLRSSTLRTGFLVLCVMWFANSLSECLTDLNGDDMSSHLWIGQYLSNIFASITRLALGFADGYFAWLGRRMVLLSAAGVAMSAASALLVQLYMGLKGRTLYLITYVTIYNAIALTWEPSFVCASELMPTDVRAKTTALLALVSRVGNLIASSLMLFKAIHEPVIMWTVLASNIVVFIVTAKWLEETKNCNLEEVGKSEGTAEASSAKAKVAPMKIEKDSIPQSKSKNGDEKPAFKRVTE